jgi:hypothetical protein
MGLSAIAAQTVAVIYNGTAYPLLILMFCASGLSLLFFRLGVGKPLPNNTIDPNPGPGDRG